MPLYYYARTKRIVEKPEEFDQRKGYTRLPDPPSVACGFKWGPDHVCTRDLGHQTRHSCECRSWAPISRN